MMMISLAPWLSHPPGLEPMCKGKVPRWTVCRDGMWGKVEGNAWMESGSSVFMKKYWSRSLCMFQSAGKLIWVLFPICQILLNGDQPYLHPKAEVSSFIYVERWKAVVTMTSPLTTECFSRPIFKNYCYSIIFLCLFKGASERGCHTSKGDRLDPKPGVLRQGHSFWICCPQWASQVCYRTPK